MSKDIRDLTYYEQIEWQKQIIREEINDEDIFNKVLDESK